MDSLWTPYGLYDKDVDSIRTPSGVYQESIRSIRTPSGCVGECNLQLRYKGRRLPKHYGPVVQAPEGAAGLLTDKLYVLVPKVQGP
jgi:hypothetical protein